MVKNVIIGGAQQVFRRSYKNKNNPNYRNGIYSKLYYCIDCKKEISKKSTRCLSCANKIRNLGKKFPEHALKMRGKNHPNWKGGRPKCIDCNIEIDYYHKRCKSCAVKYSWRNKKYDKRPKRYGIMNGNWKNGKTILQKLIRELDESNIWKKFIFNRDNYICQICGIKGKELEAHHIKPFSIILGEFLAKYSQFSPIEDKETLVRLAVTYADFWDTTNGQTLCRDCHNKTKYINQYNSKYIKNATFTASPQESNGKPLLNKNNARNVPPC